MLSVNVKIIEELKNFLLMVSGDQKLLSVFRSSPKDFTRNRKLPFDKLVLFIARLCKKTLSFELEEFFEQINISIPCSVSAFSQQRMKLDGRFFYWWNMVLWQTFYAIGGENVKRWKGYRVIAGDGSSVTLVNNTSLGDFFGGQSNGHNVYAAGRTYYAYDVLNGLILFPWLGPYRSAEVGMAYQTVLELGSQGQDMLMIYDRNFCSYKMAALHLWQEKEVKFIIRAKESLKHVRSFIESKQSAAIVELKPTFEAIAGLKESGYMITAATTIKVRLIRVELPQSVEVLMTNLWEEEGHGVSTFKELYAMRWGIETNISLQKNILQLESFSGLTTKAVIQDFYATVFIANLHSLLIKAAQHTVTNTVTKRKLNQKINNNKSFGYLKKVIVRLFIENDTSYILERLHDLFIKNTLPIRKGRSFDRIIKNKQSNSKYRTFSNFKPAY
ncbi:MAG TPA: IS4 family transposase [Chitinophagaceae bacterium]|jgi:hypothetical protein